MQTLERKTNKTQASQLKPFSSLTFIVAIALFAIVNLLLYKTNYVSKRHSISEVLIQARQEAKASEVSKHSWSWWLSKLYEEQVKAPDVVVFGSSLLGSAHASVDAQYLFQLTDVLIHRRMSYLENQLANRLGHKVTIFSLASPGEMISDFYVISKALFAPGKKPKLVIATIAPRDFIDSTLAYPAATDHYKFFSNYVDFATQNNLAYPDFFSRLAAEIERLPLKRISKLAMFGQAESAKTDWNQSELGYIKPGMALVPAAAVPKQVDNSKEYAERFREPFGPNYENEMQFFRLWLAEMKKQGISTMVFCMPTTKSNRELLSQAFWQRFRRDVSAACKANNSDWVDLSDSGLFVQSDYLDTVHLNAYGAVRLFPVIAERVSSNQASMECAPQRK